MKNIFYYKDKNFSQTFSDFLKTRQQTNTEIVSLVEKIIKDVRINKDAAVIKYTKKFDNIDLRELGIFFQPNEIEESVGKIDLPDKKAIDLSIDRIADFHKKQMPENLSWKDDLGIELGWVWKPIDRVGVYVPGGKASYPSSAIMNIVPARVAGVDDIVLASPTPDGAFNSLTLYASKAMKISKIMRVGGAQAVAAFAFGTETIEKVNKITGPGNEFVAEAKRQVFGRVGIDSVAGPSEVLLIADKTMPVKLAALDLLAQAEHDQNAQSILITNDREYALKVENEIENYLKKLKRKEVAELSWRKFGAIVIVPDFKKAIKVSNIIAPEHLQLCFANAENYLGHIKNAGSVFLGFWSPEAMGDYITGSNHVLPTNGTAKFSSSLSVFDFMKRVSITRVNKDGFKKLGPAVVRLANSEGLQAHSLSVSERLKDL
ncbi:histidinol dehydrogenase [Paracoccaceae bacterium]|nr:histidinol dehydrogenase [Paracoccaceae bacterium]